MTLKANLTTAMSHISSRQIARDADFRQYDATTAQYLHAVNLEVSGREKSHQPSAFTLPHPPPPRPA